jgi:putative flavoprotein involved in K+ transport
MKVAERRPDVFDAIVVGGGQAGLSLGWHLRRHNARFLILDDGPEIGHSWRNRWDSLRLFTPAEYDNLPGMSFPAAAGTYPSKDEVADYLAAYAARFDLPVSLNSPVIRVQRVGDRFAVHTDQGTLHTHHVVVATGPFGTPVIPAMAERLPETVVQLHSADYRNPSRIPAGPVLVVGAGNSGLQIAAELAATHQVAVARGRRSLGLPQRMLGRDLFWWLTRSGVINKTTDSVLAKRLRSRGDLVIGSSLRTLRRAGVELRPRVVSTSSSGVTFADGRRMAPGTVIWATGFRSDHSWIGIDEVVGNGRVQHERGLTSIPGLYFLGLPWQHTRGSALLGFVRHDAAWIAGHLLASMSRMRRGLEAGENVGDRAPIAPPAG